MKTLEKLTELAVEYKNQRQHYGIGTITTGSLDNMVKDKIMDIEAGSDFFFRVPTMIALSKFWFHQSISEIINKKFQKLCY